VPSLVPPLGAPSLVIAPPLAGAPDVALAPGDDPAPEALPPVLEDVPDAGLTGIVVLPPADVAAEAAAPPFGSAGALPDDPTPFVEGELVSGGSASPPHANTTIANENPHGTKPVFEIARRMDRTPTKTLRRSQRPDTDARQHRSRR
jgi:hypothetical protein